MPYIIADESFATKGMLTKRCQDIRDATPNGQPVADVSLPFLLELFRYHDEWTQKSAGIVRRISTQTTSQGTRCFILERADGTPIDISFGHAIKLVPTSRSAALLPQALQNFRAAARNAVSRQIYEFRDGALPVAPQCALIGVLLDSQNCAVDHIHPSTFDQLLFDFCQKNHVNPLVVSVGSEGGTVAIYEDQNLLAKWRAFHQEHARLRLVSRLGNLQLPKSSLPWSLLFAW